MSFGASTFGLIPYESRRSLTDFVCPLAAPDNKVITSATQVTGSSTRHSAIRSFMTASISPIADLRRPLSAGARVRAGELSLDG